MSKRDVVLAGAIVAVLALAAAPALAGFAGTDLFLPMAGRGVGAYPANWFTTLYVYNPNAVAVAVDLSFLERNRDNVADPPPTVTETLAAGETRVLDNVVETTFGRSGTVYGAVRVRSVQKVAASARIYSKETESAPMTQSFGQDFAATPASFAIGLGESTQILGGYTTLPYQDSQARFNIGCVETTGAGSATVHWVARDGDGVERGAYDRQVLRLSQTQGFFHDYFEGVDLTNARVSASVTGGAGKVICYGSLVTNDRTMPKPVQDPTTFEMLYPEEALAAGTVTGVTAGAGLIGGGGAGDLTLVVGAGDGIRVDADAVAIADGGVTGAMIKDDTITGADISDSASVRLGTLRVGGAPSGLVGASSRVYAENTSTTGEAAYLTVSGATNTSPALRVSNTGQGYAIDASATNSYAVRATSTDATGYGVYAVAHGATGRGVVGYASGASARGVWGSVTGDDAVAVYGNNGTTIGQLGTRGVAVLGRTEYTAAFIGENTSSHTEASIATGSFAVHGINQRGDAGYIAGKVGADDYFGVSGASSNWGVYGLASHGNGYGVWAYNQDSSFRAGLAGPDCAVCGWASTDAAVKADGDLVVTGEYRGEHGPNHGAPFPRPAFDSGWMSVAAGEELAITHGIGGDVNSYVVDLTFRSENGIFNAGIGGDVTGSSMRGAAWTGLTNSVIKVRRAAEDGVIDAMRVRIWVVGS